MVGVHARADIAAMANQHPFRCGAVQRFPRGAMRQTCSKLSRTHLAVAVAIARGRPNPAAVGVDSAARLEVFHSAHLVLRGIAGKLVAQKNSTGADTATTGEKAPSGSGGSCGRRDAAIKLGRGADRQREVDAPQNPSSLEGGSTRFQVGAAARALPAGLVGSPPQGPAGAHHSPPFTRSRASW